MLAQLFNHYINVSQIIKDAQIMKKKAYDMLIYQKMRGTDINNWYIELYENFPCDNKEQLNKKRRNY